MDLSAALPTFVITLREGVEAALVVGIVLAYLKKAEQTRLNASVYAGIGVGVLASVLVGVVFNGLLSALETSQQPYTPVVKPLLEGVFGVVAIVLLSWMLVWMTQQARSMKSEIEGAVSEALQQTGSAGWGVFGLITIAVLREGFETVVFISAQFQQGWMPALGAIAGLVGAVGIGILLFQLGVKINLRQFFQVMGVLLLLIVAGLVVGALRHFNAAVATLAQVDIRFADLCPPSHDSCILGGQVWDLSTVLPDRQFPGVLLKAFFGYTQKLYWVQAIAYLVFLITVGSIYFQSIAGKPLQSTGVVRPNSASEG
ncbi:FTR1 family iron permease [Phormidium tenue FACHB-886]|nr:FTR1 family iron permease [Phormidium tenue FACHB-886]